MMIDTPQRSREATLSGAVAPRCLVVTFNRLIPADQGNARRIMQMVRLYKAQGFEVDLLYHDEEGFDPALSHALAGQFGHVNVVRSRAPKHILPGHVCRIADWYDRGLEAAARDMHRLRGYSVVHVNYVWYAPLLDQFGSDVVKVLDTHDVFGERRTKYTAAGMKPQWFSTTFADEDAALRRADAALAIQKEEATELAARGHRNILYLPYVEPALRPFAPRGGGHPLTFGYLGSGNDWNILSVNGFISRLQSRGVHFPHPIVVAGGVCRHVREATGVIKLGFVQELHTFYDAIDIALNPMVGGTGLKIKTVEPLSYGKPVLTTLPGAQGLTHLWQLPVFDDNAALADHLFEQFIDPESPALARIIDQAADTRAALDAEYDGQVGRLGRWLAAKV
jgi:polysaccharide biosynthesis protein PslH